MTKSFGNPGRKPSRPVNRGNKPDRTSATGFGQDPQQEVNNPAAWANRSGAPSSQQEGEEEFVEGKKPDPNKRIVALLFDFAAAYLVGVIIAMIPFVNRFIPLQIVLVAVLLSRDHLFGGRGFGKNLMGLRVVDANTGDTPTIVQSILRNIVLMAPFVVLQTIPLLLKFSPFGWFNEAVMSLINIVGMLYVAIVLPLESYRAYSREDGLRFGDELAGTTIVDSTMDFSNPFNR
ncbi:MAG: RDD family protein [Cyanobacteria bacterium SZAS-4]|nr:RDD family protein [Cyanobacteria bacterium SZAS-4]